MITKIKRAVKTLLLVQFFFSSIILAQTGSIQGVIIDSQTKEPLPYSNAVIMGQSLGGAADNLGHFVIRNVPVGKVTLKASFVGYKKEEVIVNVIAGKTIELTISLDPETIEGETVIVTAQAEGQMEAINEQLQSIPIKSVVSSARIQELPDVNAAESVSRLPGVSLIRTGGEGSKVVIRGLSPQYNQVTVDGVELPSDVASANNIVSSDKGQQSNSVVLGDRAADLSMISSNMLGGIEVIKAITPDMDATLIGGVINFGLRKAARGAVAKNFNEPWLPLIQITSQGGYNNLKDEYNNYKFVGSVEQRFFNQEFGVFLQGSIEKRNLSANTMGAAYNLVVKTLGEDALPNLSTLNLTDSYSLRERNGLTAVLDYDHSTGEIGLMNFFSRSDTRWTNRTETIYADGNDVWFSVADNHQELNIVSNLLSIKQDIPFFHVDLKFSHSFTDTKSPEDLSFDFWQEDAGLSNKGDLTKVHPTVLAGLVAPNINNAGLMNITTSQSYSKERILNGSLDFQSELTFAEWLTGKFKFGGSYHYRNRWYDFNSSSGNQGYSGGGNIIAAFQRAYPGLQFAGGRLGMINFLDADYDYGEFLDGEYTLPYVISPDFMWNLLPIAKRTTSLEGYQVNKLGSAVNDYSGNEQKSAVYVMGTFNIGQKITIIPGVRFQNLRTEWEAMRGETVPGGIQGKDTTVIRSHGFWLPMVHLRYKPLEWLQLHFAYTNTLNYPDYGVITPRYYIGPGFVSYNNWRLRPAASENLDFVVSVYANEVGLFTVNGFKKRITDLVFPTQTYVTDFSNYPDLPQKQKSLYQFNTYINNPIGIDIYGIETEWQTSFWYLPRPLNNFVMNINYTHIFSEAGYPRSVVYTNYNPDGTFNQVIVDSFYTTRMLDQPKDVFNFSVGYDYKGFSSRVSMLYQDNIFKRPDFWYQLRSITDKMTRWDLSVKQNFPFGIQLFFNLNNITGESDVTLNQRNSFPTAEEHYGMSADLGIVLKL